MENNKLIVDITGLSRYHENLKNNVLTTKQDVISDLETIRTGAAAGANASADAQSKADAAQAAAIAAAATDATNKADAAQAAAEATAAADATSKADAAESAAKSYADDLVKDEDGNVKFDAVGSAAAAQAAAEATASADATSKANAAQAAAEATAAADATSKANAAQAAAEATAKAYVNRIVDDVTGEDGVVTKGLNSRIAVLEAIDHKKLASDASAAAVAAIVAGAESDFDTLKDVADWINSDTTGAAALQIKVSENAEAITDLTNDKQDVISDLETIRSGAAAGATAEATAKTYTDAEIVKVNAVIEENERVTAESLTDLDTRVKDLKDITYNKTEVDEMIGNVIVVASDDDIDNLFN